ncbi:MAG: CIA30 family protein [Patescibacteria group bacterium]
MPNREAAGNWHIENDDVMGGVSQSRIEYHDEIDGKIGVMSFEGEISLRNNGGFAQVLYTREDFDLSGFDGLELVVKGDGKRYQIRIETIAKNVGYTHIFLTQEKWEVVKLKFKDFTPDHHGEPVPDAPPMNLKEIRSFGILIGNNKEESFKFLLNKINFF